MRTFLVILSVCIACVSAARWTDGDAIIIDGAELTNKVKRDVEDDTIVRTAECTTTRGRNGMCKELRECYPMLYPIDRNVSMPEGTLNDGLAEILVQVSGFCDVVQNKFRSAELFNLVAKSEVLICCPEQATVPPQILPQKPVVITQNDPELKATQGSCGNVKIDTHGLPGREAIKGEFVFIVALMNGNRQFCGGSLISNQWIVTAAHCVQHMGASDVAKLRVLLGDHNIYSTADGPSESRGVIKVLYHRGFSMQHLHHDIAMLQLDRPVTYSTYIQPVCIHSGTPSIDNLKADVAGWGQLSDNGPQPQTLRTANVRIWTAADCKRRYGSQAPAGIGAGMVCSGGSGQDSCRGDSGGPLSINSKQNAQLVGIVSWGIGCGSYPGVYTRVSSYNDWITKNQRRA